ncbi:hypothetical protein [Halomarina ordinaria]|uniref:Uncharacterized protein n=1 Tax=Halomarina ordinaria TaxID=3033939 RepID=A0ABD5UCZ9_9EURY|nr:hypothetical protein [Halomarina sp. PSRA2]
MADDGTMFVAGLLVVALLAGATAVDDIGAQTERERLERADGPHLVEPTPDGDRLWPYTSKRQDFSTRTLALNVVVLDDPTTVRAAMTDDTAVDWQVNNTTDGPVNESAPAENATNGTFEDAPFEVVDDRLVWRDAHGATRYTYVEPAGADPEAGGDGEWLRERYQLHDGTYLGARDHVRAYAPPGADWTAMQAHSEHWDWFRLRHTVSGISDAQRRVEVDFMDAPFVDEVIRVNLGNGGTADGDGWASVVRFVPSASVPAAALLLLPVGRHLGLRFDGEGVRSAAAALAPAVVPAGLYLGVRVGGIALEGILGGVTPKVAAGLLYPVLAFGVPAAAVASSRACDRGTAFTLVAVGLGVAVVLDYALLGVASLPIRVVLHRGAVLLAAGILAAGGAASDRRTVALGAACWVTALVLPLIGAV